MLVASEISKSHEADCVNMSKKVEKMAMLDLWRCVDQLMTGGLDLWYARLDCGLLKKYVAHHFVAYCGLWFYRVQYDTWVEHLQQV